MMVQLIDDVYKALNADCYFAALSLALTLPDICGKAEFPREVSIKSRYTEWYDEFVGKYEQCHCDQCHDNPMPYLSGEVVYSLRNSLLHQGTPNIDIDKIKCKVNKIDRFELALESKKPFDIYSDASSIINGEKRTYRVNVRRLCLLLCLSSKAYYESNQDKFDFFTCFIIDWDVEVEKLYIKNSRTHAKCD